MKRVYGFITGFILIFQAAQAATYTVTNTFDSGSGSLREAITLANANPGKDVIQFAIPGSGPHVIYLSSALPALSEQVQIDGYTQPGAYTATASYPARILIVIDMNSFPGSGLELTFTSGTSEIYGLSIVNATYSTSAGIYLNNCATTLIAGNYIGIYPDGSYGGNYTGIKISGTDLSTIGGSIAGRNVISSNLTHGVLIESIGANEATGNTISYNYIGTSASGTSDLGNLFDGIRIMLCDNNIISDNLISGNNWKGMYLGGTSVNPVAGTLIRHNIIGLDAKGQSLKNSQDGIHLDFCQNTVIGGSGPYSNTIAGNGGNGVVVTGNTTSAGNEISYNSIYSNTLLGIDLNNDGVTANDTGDGDTGPNALQNFPVIDSAVLNGANLTVYGKFQGTSSVAYRLEFFNNPRYIGVDGTDYGEGHSPIGTLTVTGTGSEAVFTFPASGVTLYNDSITSTATEVASLNTSEFSASRRVTSNKDYICDDLGPWTRTYTINAVPLATSYTWSVPPGATITSGQNSTSIDVDWTGVTPGNYEVCVVANSSCGTSPSSCFPIVVYHCCIPPVVNNMATSLCSGGAIGVVLPTLGTSGTAITRYDITAVQDPGLSGTPTTGTNITDPNAIASDAFSNSTNTPLQVVYTVTPYSYSCAGGIFTVTVTVNPFPTVAVNPGDQTVCPGAAFTIDITNPNNVAGTTFSWTRTDNPALTGMLLSGTGTPITGTFSSSSPQTSQSTTFTVTATATGCSTSTGATVTVIDNTGPVVVNCPSSVNQGTNAGLCVATVTWSEPTANDNCDGALAYFSRSHAPGSTFPIGITTVTYIFQDAAGNGATCTFNVTVSDTEGPAITCPADINTYEQPAGSGSASVTVPVPATGDNCGVASVINSFTGTDNASGSYPLGTTTVIYTVTDTYGNVTTCSFDVTVEVCPIPGVITGPTAVCRTASETYSIVPVPGAISYNWTVPTGSVITSGQGTTSITVTIGPNPGNICVTASNGICESAPSCTAITVNDVPPRPVFIE